MIFSSGYKFRAIPDITFLRNMKNYTFQYVPSQLVGHIP